MAVSTRELRPGRSRMKSRRTHPRRWAAAACVPRFRETLHFDSTSRPAARGARGAYFLRRFCGVGVRFAGAVFRFADAVFRFAGAVFRSGGAAFRFADAVFNFAGAVLRLGLPGSCVLAPTRGARCTWRRRAKIVSSVRTTLSSSTSSASAVNRVRILPTSRSACSTRSEAASSTSLGRLAINLKITRSSAAATGSRTSPIRSKVRERSASNSKPDHARETSRSMPLGV